jgi:hypothetical protein
MLWTGVAYAADHYVDTARRPPGLDVDKVVLTTGFAWIPGGTIDYVWYGTSPWCRRRGSPQQTQHLAWLGVGGYLG